MRYHLLNFIQGNIEKTWKNKHKNMLKIKRYIEYYFSYITWSCSRGNHCD